MKLMIKFITKKKKIFVMIFVVSLLPIQCGIYIEKIENEEISYK
jgi:uncharacterized membrane protein YraQ (UPF0718 family)